MFIIIYAYYDPYSLWSMYGDLCECVQCGTLVVVIIHYSHAYIYNMFRGTNSESLDLKPHVMQH